MSDPVDTGFEDVLKGEVWIDPQGAGKTVVGLDFGREPSSVTVTVKPEEPCSASSTAAVAAPASPSTPAPIAPLPSTSLTAAGVQAAKSLLQLPELSWPELSKLARDMAMDIKERHTILTEHKLTQTQYDFLEANNDFYRNAFAEACRQWHAPLSTQERIKVEAAAILEDSLLGIGARMQNRAEGLPGVIEAAKLFAKVAGVGEPSGGQISSGERFVINIDLGGDQKISIGVGGEADPLPAPVQLRALPADGEGA